MSTQLTKRIVDNRVLLLGIDQRYRNGMKLFESKVLLDCAVAVAKRLGVVEADVPLEGYYADSDIPELAKYFRLVRALQNEPRERASSADGMVELKRLLEVTGSAMYGRPQYERGDERFLLPVGRDPLSEALRGLVPPSWNVGSLLAGARNEAVKHDDISLVGLAARVGDPVVLAALRESAVLYAEKRIIIGGGPKYEYVWRVDDEIARCANRFIDLFNSLVASANAALPASAWSSAWRSGLFALHAREPIPAAAAKNAADFYSWFDDNKIMGRCAHLGTRAGGEKYHWAVRAASSMQDGGDYEVHDFWSAELWTSSRYRSEHGASLRSAGSGSSTGGLEIV